MQTELDFFEANKNEIRNAHGILMGSIGYIKADNLARAVGVSGRNLRRIIIWLREHGEPVMSSKRGYCYARTQAERDASMSIFEQRAQTAIRNYAAAAKMPVRDAAIKIAGMV
jgi:predicted DNA-binding transcriptional regulator YafY